MKRTVCLDGLTTWDLDGDFILLPSDSGEWRVMPLKRRTE